MDTIQDLGDMLSLLNKQGAKYLIVGGQAFIFHAKPRYTKDMDLWVDAPGENVDRVNTALAEFGSPYALNADGPWEILPIGVEPDRINLLRHHAAVSFPDAWGRRIIAKYGAGETYWIQLDDRIAEAIAGFG